MSFLCETPVKRCAPGCPDLQRKKTRFLGVVKPVAFSLEDVLSDSVSDSEMDSTRGNFNSGGDSDGDSDSDSDSDEDADALVRRARNRELNKKLKLTLALDAILVDLPEQIRDSLGALDCLYNACNNSDEKVVVFKEFKQNCDGMLRRAFESFFGVSPALSERDRTAFDLRRTMQRAFDASGYAPEDFMDMDATLLCSYVLEQVLAKTVEMIIAYVNIF
jgi:hypothetical protein